MVQFFQCLSLALENFCQDRLLDPVMPENLDRDLSVVIEHVTAPVDEGHTSLAGVRGQGITVVDEPRPVQGYCGSGFR